MNKILTRVKSHLRWIFYHASVRKKYNFLPIVEVGLYFFEDISDLANNFFQQKNPVTQQPLKEGSSLVHPFCQPRPKAKSKKKVGFQFKI